MTCHKLISLDKSTPRASSGEEEEGGTRSENQHKHWEDNCQILQNVGTCLKMTINVIWFNDDYEKLMVMMIIVMMLILMMVMAI